MRAGRMENAGTTGSSAIATLAAGRLRPAAALLSCLLACGFLAGQDAPAPSAKPSPAPRAGQDPVPTQRVVRISDDSAVQPGEVSAAIDPNNPDRIVVVSVQSGQSFGKRAPNAVYFTTDGGRRWRTVFAPNPLQHMMGDDFVVFGPDGFAHRAWINFEGIRTPRPDRANNGIWISSSNDLRNWSVPTPAVAHLNTVIPFEDKPALAVDCSPDSPGRGNLYVAWTRFAEYGSRKPEDKSHVWFSRSTNAGRSFSVPIRVSRTPGDCVDSDGTVMGAVPAVGPDGHLCLFWAGPRGIVCVRSNDAGLTFSEETVVSETPGGWDLPVPGLQRHNGLPSAAADCSNGPHRGRVYVCWIDERLGDADVFCSFSDDKGQTWAGPNRVNGDREGNGRAQLFAALAVDRAGGSVNVGYLDRRFADPLDTGAVLSRSVDGGKSFTHHPADQPPFKFQSRLFYGDYIGVSAVAGRVIVAYPYVVSADRLAVYGALFDFRPDAGAKTKTVGENHAGADAEP